MNMDKLLSIILMLLLTQRGSVSSSFQRCDKVPKYLDKLYRQLTVKRKYEGTKHQRVNPTASAIPWRNSSLRLYFNLTSLSTQTQIFDADLILYRSQPSFMQTMIYQQSFGITLKDVNTSTVIYNRTLASDDRFCLIKNVVKLVQRWQSLPASNEGLLLTVKDTGRYSTTLETFYPKKNIYVPAFALFLKPGRNFLKRYKLIPSQTIEIMKTRT